MDRHCRCGMEVLRHFTQPDRPAFVDRRRAGPLLLPHLLTPDSQPPDLPRKRRTGTRFRHGLRPDSQAPEAGAGDRGSGPGAQPQHSLGKKARTNGTAGRTHRATDPARAPDAGADPHAVFPPAWIDRKRSRAARGWTPIILFGME